MTCASLSIGLNLVMRIIHLTNIKAICLIDVAAKKQLAAMLFGNETIAHDKGKPVARQGRKAKSLPAPATSDTTAQGKGRLSGCRRRSEIVRSLIARAADAPATIRSAAEFCSRLDIFAPDAPLAGFDVPTGTTGPRRPQCNQRFPHLHRASPSALLIAADPANQSSIVHRRNPRSPVFTGSFGMDYVFRRASLFPSVPRLDARRCLQRLKALP